MVFMARSLRLKYNTPYAYFKAVDSPYEASYYHTSSIFNFPIY